MAWVRIDDQFADHPKVKSVGIVGMAIQMASICYCNRYLTDGFIGYSTAEAIINSLCSPITNNLHFKSSDTPSDPSDKNSQNIRIYEISLTCGMGGYDLSEFDWAKIMVSAGLWEKTKGGYLIHDYLDYNPTKEVVTQRKEASSRGGKTAQKRASDTPSDTPSKPKPNPNSNTKEKAEEKKKNENPDAAIPEFVVQNQKRGTCQTPGSLLGFQKPNGKVREPTETENLLNELCSLVNFNAKDRGYCGQLIQTAALTGKLPDVRLLIHHLREAKSEGRLNVKEKGIILPAVFVIRNLQKLGAKPVPT